jgi:hypothetical protein
MGKRDRERKERIRLGIESPISAPSPCCPVCGGDTVPIGRVAGDWVKIPRGEHCGKPYWYLKEPPAEVADGNRH